MFTTYIVLCGAVLFPSERHNGGSSMAEAIKLSEEQTILTIETEVPHFAAQLDAQA